MSENDPDDSAVCRIHNNLIVVNWIIKSKCTVWMYLVSISRYHGRTIPRRRNELAFAACLLDMVCNYVKRNGTMIDNGHLMRIDFVVYFLIDGFDFLVANASWVMNDRHPPIWLVALRIPHVCVTEFDIWIIMMFISLSQSAYEFNFWLIEDWPLAYIDNWWIPD